MTTRTKPTTHDGPLVLQTLGAVALRVTNGEGPPAVVLGPGKPLALLTYLALSPGRASNREHLIDLLWSDLEPDRSKHALRQTIYFIRSQLGDEALCGRPGELGLGVPLVTDRDLFLEAVEEGELERAAELYTGSFLPGFASPGGAEFEHWADLERERLRGIFVRSAESLARQHLSRSAFREAQRLARRMRDEDPLNESNWRLLIESLVAGGDQLTASIEADALTTLLQSEGRSAEPATRAVMRLARQRSETLQQESHARGLATELVGRESEFAGIIRAWDSARAGRPRHVHVSAPAGLGKTRLLNDVHGRLRASGALVVYLRANPGDRRIAYLLAGEMGRALGTLPGAAAISPAAASALVALHPGLSSHFSAPMDQSTGDEALRRRTMALSELVAAVADEAPFALLVDDVHWSDSASTQMLLGVLERLGPARLLVVTTARTAREDLMAASASHRLVLEPLTVAQVGALLASLGELPLEDWTDAFVAALHGTTGGSPLLVLETLQLALDRGSLTLDEGRWACGDPVFLITEFQAGGALRHRIAQLDAESRDLLVLLATAGAPLAIARVARAAGQSVEDTEARLGGLERRGFVTRTRNDWEPTHDQIAEIAVEAAPLAVLTAAHSALGRVLASDAEFDQRVYPRAAHHLAAAHEFAELDRLFGGWVDLARARGDHRTATALAAELLGGDADAGPVRRMVHSLPVSRRTPGLPWRGAVAAISLLLIALSVTVAALDGVNPEPPAGFAGVDLLAMEAGDGDTVRVLRASLDPRAIAGGEPLALDEAAVAGVFAAWSRVIGSPEMSPDGTRWAYAMATPDSGVADIYITGEGRPLRLTTAAGYDVAPAWAPDGRGLVFVSDRWSRAGGAAGNGDIAIMYFPGEGVHRLTRNAADDRSPRWSPDGSRIAFARRHDDSMTEEVCWVAIDGGRGECAPVPMSAVSVLAWQGTAHVLVLAESDADEVIARIAVDDGSFDVIARGAMSQAGASANGLWVTCLCQRPGDSSPAWYAFAAGAPQVARRVTLADGDAPVMVDWGRVSAEGRHVTALAIGRPDRPITSDATYRLRWSALGAGGAQVALPEAVLRWRSSDTGIAAIDTLRGVVRPRGVGRVVIHASAGGWVSDSIELTIAAPNPRPLLGEDWSDAAASEWHAFGTPRPKLVRTARDVAALAPGGDGSFRSGVYSRLAARADAGLGMETMLAAAPTANPRQSVTVALTAALDSTALAGWDHLTGDPPGNRLEALQSCSITYPATGGLASGRFLLNAAATTGRVAVPESTSPPGWYRVRLQIFSDGTCGVAINGVPAWRSDASLATEHRYRVEISARSEGAPMVGPVEVWDGVRGGVDWTMLEE